MGVINFGRVNANAATRDYGENNNVTVLTSFLVRKLGSRDVDLEGVEFVARSGSKHPGKRIVDAYRGNTWIASANVNRHGEIKYSMPGTDRKK